jgi:hypothetical protein
MLFEQMLFEQMLFERMLFEQMLFDQMLFDQMLFEQMTFFRYKKAKQRCLSERRIFSTNQITFYALRKIEVRDQRSLKRKIK